MLKGILILNGKKYSNGKHIEYICKNSDKNIEDIKLSYKVKLDFQKNVINKYVYYTDKIENIMGNVNNYDAYVEYEIINVLKYGYNKEDKLFQKKCENITFPPLLREEDEFIFTIDGESTKDFDDAVSITDTHINIYISNVPKILEEYDLFKYINKISSIYLPNKTINMLPKILSENLCSLKKDNVRNVFYMNINLETLEISFNTKNVYISKNFIYESEELLKNNNYVKLSEEVKKLNNKYKYLENIKNSHEVIEFLMVLMNYHSSKILNKGIFRSCTRGDEMIKEIKFFFGGNGNYIKEKNGHEILKLDSYLHITSPIRRIVDIVNMLSLQIQLNLFNGNINNFIDENIGRIEEINAVNKKIRKMQNRVSLINLSLTTNILENIYEGYVFILDGEVKNKNGTFSYLVYLLDLKLVLPLKSVSKLKFNEKYNFKIYLFMNEGVPKKKIKIEIIS